MATSIVEIHLRQIGGKSAGAAGQMELAAATVEYLTLSTLNADVTGAERSAFLQLGLQKHQGCCFPSTTIENM